jgi:hypothetical protein
VFTSTTAGSTFEAIALASAGPPEAMELEPDVPEGKPPDPKGKPPELPEEGGIVDGWEPPAEPGCQAQ